MSFIIVHSCKAVYSNKRLAFVINCRLELASISMYIRVLDGQLFSQLAVKVLNFRTTGDSSFSLLMKHTCFSSINVFVSYFSLLHLRQWLCVSDLCVILFSFKLWYTPIALCHNCIDMQGFCVFMEKSYMSCYILPAEHS